MEKNFKSIRKSQRKTLNIKVTRLRDELISSDPLNEAGREIQQSGLCHNRQLKM